MRMGRRAMAGLALAALLATPAWADEPKGKPLVISQAAISQALATPAPPLRPVAPRVQPRLSAGKGGSGKRAAWTAVGAVGGFFGGAFLGAGIENAVHPCNCDDPGLMGALIGMPVGAVAGGIAGFLLSK